MNQQLINLVAKNAGYKDPRAVGTCEDYAYFDHIQFAKLIIRECVKIVDDMADPGDSERYFWAIQNASQKIKQHFGVE